MKNAKEMIKTIDQVIESLGKRGLLREAKKTVAELINDDTPDNIKEALRENDGCRTKKQFIEEMEWAKEVINNSVEETQEEVNTDGGDDNARTLAESPDYEQQNIASAYFRVANRGPVACDEINQIREFYSGVVGMERLNSLDGTLSIQDIMEEIIAMWRESLEPAEKAFSIIKSDKEYVVAEHSCPNSVSPERDPVDVIRIASSINNKYSVGLECCWCWCRVGSDEYKVLSKMAIPSWRHGID